MESPVEYGDIPIRALSRNTQQPREPLAASSHSLLPRVIAAVHSATMRKRPAAFASELQNSELRRSLCSVSIPSETYPNSCKTSRVQPGFGAESRECNSPWNKRLSSLGLCPYKPLYLSRGPGGSFDRWCRRTHPLPLQIWIDGAVKTHNELETCTTSPKPCRRIPH